MKMLLIFQFEILRFRLLGLTPTTQLINGLTCQSYRPYLGSNTDYLCSKIPQLHVLLHRSNVQARQQCVYHFRDHPWGCRFSSNLTPLRRFLRQSKLLNDIDDQDVSILILIFAFQHRKKLRSTQL